MFTTRNLGFYGYPDYTVYSDGRVFSHKRGKFLKPFLMGPKNREDARYLTVRLYDSRGEHEDFRIHTLLGICFFGYVPGSQYEVMNHLDGDKFNNDITNFCVVTASENTQHAYDTGLKARTFSKEQVIKICELIQEGYLLKDIQEILPFARDKYNTLMDIKRRKVYTKISKDFQW